MKKVTKILKRHFYNRNKAHRAHHFGRVPHLKEEDTVEAEGQSDGVNDDLTISVDGDAKVTNDGDTINIDETEGSGEGEGESGDEEVEVEAVVVDDGEVADVETSLNEALTNNCHDGVCTISESLIKECVKVAETLKEVTVNGDQVISKREEAESGVEDELQSDPEITTEEEEEELDPVHSEEDDWGDEEEYGEDAFDDEEGFEEGYADEDGEAWDGEEGEDDYYHDEDEGDYEDEEGEGDWEDEEGYEDEDEGEYESEEHGEEHDGEEDHGEEDHGEEDHGEEDHGEEEFGDYEGTEEEEEGSLQFDEDGNPIDNGEDEEEEMDHEDDVVTGSDEYNADEHENFETSDEELRGDEEVDEEEAEESEKAQEHINDEQASKEGDEIVQEETEPEPEADHEVSLDDVEPTHYKLGDYKKVSGALFAKLKIMFGEIPLNPDETNYDKAEDMEKTDKIYTGLVAGLANYEREKETFEMDVNYLHTVGEKLKDYEGNMLEFYGQQEKFNEAKGKMESVPEGIQAELTSKSELFSKESENFATYSAEIKSEFENISSALDSVRAMDGKSAEEAADADKVSLVEEMLPKMQEKLGGMVTKMEDLHFTISEMEYIQEVVVDEVDKYEFEAAEYTKENYEDEPVKKHKLI